MAEGKKCPGAKDRSRERCPEPRGEARCAFWCPGSIVDRPLSVKSVVPRSAQRRRASHRRSTEKPSAGVGPGLWRRNGGVLGGSVPFGFVHGLLRPVTANVDGGGCRPTVY